MVETIVNLDDLMERLVPYELSQSQKDFQNLICNNPHLKDSLEKQLVESKEWAKRAADGEDVFFFINDVSWKYTNHLHKNNICLSYIDSKELRKQILVITVNIYHQ